LSRVRIVDETGKRQDTLAAAAAAGGGTDGASTGEDDKDGMFIAMNVDGSCFVIRPPDVRRRLSNMLLFFLNTRPIISQTTEQRLVESEL